MTEPVRLCAVFLNCTLKKSPAVSNTQALMAKVVEWFDTMDVQSEMVRIVDHAVAFGVTSDEGDGDEWPVILERIKAADIIVVGTPIWFGVRGSVCQLVMERLDGTYAETNEAGQYRLYNKVAGVVVTGNEDGAHAAAETTLFNSPTSVAPCRPTWTRTGWATPARALRTSRPAARIILTPGEPHGGWPTTWCTWRAS